MGIVEKVLEVLQENREDVIDLVAEARSIWDAATHELSLPTRLADSLGVAIVEDVASIHHTRHVASLGAISASGGNPRAAVRALLGAIQERADAMNGPLGRDATLDEVLAEAAREKLEAERKAAVENGTICAADAKAVVASLQAIADGKRVDDSPDAVKAVLAGLGVAFFRPKGAEGVSEARPSLDAESSPTGASGKSLAAAADAIIGRASARRDVSPESDSAAD